MIASRKGPLTTQRDVMMIEPFVPGRRDVGDDLAVDAEAADEGHEHSRLAGDVGAQVPRISAQHKAVGGAAGAFLGPVGSRGSGCFQRRGPMFAEVADRFGDPVDVQFGMQRHVGQHRWAARPGDVE